MRIEALKRIAKQANWLTDLLITDPLTKAYARQNEKWKAEQAAKAKAEAAKPKPPAPAKTQQPPPRVQLSNGRYDALAQLAQGVSSSYRAGSTARPQFISGGKVIAR